jgi:predicted nucleic acid-binding protein
MVLIDSTIYIEWQRSKSGLMGSLLHFTECHETAVCGVICCEVGGGIRDRALRQCLKAIWNTLVYLPTDSFLWEESEELLWNLERQGKRIPLADAIIASCAKQAGATIYTRDGHFDLVPGIRVAHRMEDL